MPKTKMKDRSTAAAVATVLALLGGAPGLSGCGGGESSSGDGGSTTTTTSCAPGELTRDDGTCRPAGAPDEPCPPGELLLDDGSCQEAGVPASACGAGFLPDGKEGCEPILPADACPPDAPCPLCPPGQMAVPGDTECHEVSPCGDGTWGDIPVEADTQFVDQSYAGGDSDGSKEKPWTTIQKGIDSAEDGAIVAVAAGSYPEDVKIASKPKRLWGRCPAMVEIVGTGAVGATIGVLKNTSGTEIHGVAITGVAGGIFVSGANGIEMSGVWVHDTGGYAIPIQDDLGTTKVLLEGSLVEQNHGAGVFVAGAEATIEATTIRSTLPYAGGSGSGIQIQDDADKNVQATVNVRGCLVEQNYKYGVFVGGSAATIETTVVRSTQLDAQGKFGRGIDVEEDPDTGLRANVTVRGCVVEQNHEIGVRIRGSDATIEATVIRSTLPAAGGSLGDGIDIEGHSQTNARANVTVRSCLIDQNHDTGASVLGSDAVIESTVVRSTLPDGTGENGRGIDIENDRATKMRANATVRACVVEQNRETGVFVGGSDVTIENTAVRSTLLTGKGVQGRGIGIEYDPEAKERANATVRDCLVEENHEIGVFVSGSDVTIETTTVRSTLPTENAKPEAQGGRGIDIQNDPKDMDERAAVKVLACLVEQNRDVGVYVALADATIEASVVRDTAANGDSQLGDGIAVDTGTATVEDVAVTHNARAGISSFGAHVQVTDAVITCNGFDLDGEPSFDGTPFSFDGSTGWQCSKKPPAACTDLGDCSVLTSNLEPPQTLSSGGN